MIEILVVIAIITIALSSLLGMAILSLKISNSLKDTSQADVLTRDTMEAIRNFRDGTSWYIDGIGILPNNTDCYFRVSGSSAWEFVPGVETIDQFSRKVVFYDVMRDANRNIVQADGVVDPDTKKVEVTVSWKDKEIKIEAYFTNWKK